MMATMALRYRKHLYALALVISILAPYARWKCARVRHPATPICRFAGKGLELLAEPEVAW
jgi:hypothetical protein